MFIAYLIVIEMQVEAELTRQVKRIKRRNIFSAVAILWARKILRLKTKQIIEKRIN